MHGSFPNSMDAALGAWCVGVATPLVFPALPQASSLVIAGGIVAGVVAMGIAAARPPAGVVAGCLLLGLGYGTVAGHDGLMHRLPDCADGTRAQLSGRVTALSTSPGAGPGVRPARFELELEGPPVPVPVASQTFSDDGCRPDIRRVRLSWFRAESIAVGERWHFEVRLRRPRGFQNRGGFDYEAWLFSRSLDAIGYVRGGYRLSEAGGFARFRQRMRERLHALGLAQTGYLDALIFGATGSISQSQWEQLRRTGTVHLMVVSGLHIGLVAAMGYGIGRWGASPPVAVRRWPARRQGTLLAFLSATGYAILAGGSLPVQRAWSMAMVMLLCLLVGRRMALTRWFLLTLAAILAWRPLAPMQTGFWLSFGAVAILLGTFATRTSIKRGRRLLSAQGALFIAMAPLLAGTLGVVPALAPIANAVAVPVVSVLVVPLALLGGTLLGIAPPLADPLLRGADGVLSALLSALAVIAEHGAVIHLTSTAPRYERLLEIGSGTLLIGLLFVPGPLLRRAALLLSLAALPQSNERPRIGEFRLAMLDVGQGLAVHAQSTAHDMLYDTGARYPSGFDIGATVVNPALSADGVFVLDALLISHADNDHSGGARAVIQQTAPRWIVAGDVGDARCSTRRRWQWDGVLFEHLRASSAEAGNDASCVVLIRGTGGRALLSGDIEAQAEAALMALRPGPVDVLTAPHHGSATSSTRLFLRHLRPRWVLVSSGHRNRFGHPHESVVARYDHFRAAWMTTAEGGALRWSSESPGELGLERPRHPPYWRVSSTCQTRPRNRRSLDSSPDSASSRSIARPATSRSNGCEKLSSSTPRTRPTQRTLE